MGKLDHLPTWVLQHGSGPAAWLEQVGEVDLLGGWAEVGLAEEFAASADKARYQVFVTSYDAIFVFVQNRSPRSFELHAAPGLARARLRSVRCAYRLVAPCTQATAF